jgi:hypothetical protein
LSNHVDRSTRDNTLIPAISEAIRISIPAYYKALKDIAQNVGVPYSGEMRRSNYESLYQAVEQYGSLQPSPLIANTPSTSD